MTGGAPATHHHPLFSRLWLLLAPRFDAHGGSDLREELLAGLHGRVVEIGAADGRNFPHYPAGVREVVAIEPERILRERAGVAAREAPVPITVVGGVAEALPLPDDSVDVVVSSLVLCSVDDQRAAVGEMRRVLRPGGRLRVLEHVAAARPSHHRLQRVMDATVWPRCGGGCHTARDTVGTITDGGFEPVRLRRFRLPAGRVPNPASPWVLGELAAPATTGAER